MDVSDQPADASSPPELEGPKPLVISDENLSLSARGIWEGTGPAPAQVAERLRSFVEHLHPSRGWARVIVGVRRQDHWLASRYAQSARQFPAFSQEDFEQRVRVMTDGPTPDPQRRLSYAEVHRRFADAFGPENLLFLPMEGLTHEPERWLGRLGDFLVSDDVLPTYRASLEEGSARRNERSVGGDRWVLGNDGDTIELTAETSALVLDRFRVDNDLFAEQVDLDVAGLGYHG